MKSKVKINLFYGHSQRKLSKIIKDKDCLDLLFDIIDSFSTEKGLPIGNLTSQFFANLYLSELEKTPRAAAVRLLPRIAVGFPFLSYLPIRGPSIQAPMQAHTPPTIWTAVEPAKSWKPS